MEGCGYGGGEGGRGGRGLGWQNLAVVHHGGISTKIISPWATEGGGSVLWWWRGGGGGGVMEVRYREVRDCRSTRLGG